MLSFVRTAFFVALYYHPMLCVQLWVLIFYPSWRAALLVCLTLAFGAIWVMAAVGRMRSERLSGVERFVKQFGGCTFTPLAVPSPMAGPLKTYVVGRVRGVKRPRHIAAFHAMNGGYLFLLDPPNEQSSTSRFTIQHELGHVTQKAVLLSMERIGAGLGTIAFSWILLFSVQSWATFGACLLWICGQGIMRARIDTELSLKLREECLADVHAIARVSPADLETVMQTFERYGLPDDSLGSDLVSSEARAQIRAECIRRRLRDGRVPEIDEMKTIEPMVEDQRGYLLNLVSCAVVAALGQSIDGWKFVALGAFAVLIFVGIPGFAWGGDSTVTNIDRLLDDKASKPAAETPATV